MRVKVVLGFAAALVVVLGAADLLQHYDVRAGLALPLSVLRIVPWALLGPGPRRAAGPPAAVPTRAGRTSSAGRALVAWTTTLAATYVAAAAGGPVGPEEPWPWAVTSVLAAHQIIANELRVEQASLDEAFVRLTGRAAEN